MASGGNSEFKYHAIRDNGINPRFYIPFIIVRLPFVRSARSALEKI